MAHYVYFVDRPCVRAKLEVLDGEYSEWTVEYRSDWNTDDWQMYSGIHMSMKDIEDRVYNGFFEKEVR